MNGEKQKEMMKFDPVTGAKDPYPSLAAHYREYHGGAAWFFNPWHGNKRHALDVGSDPLGYGIV